jgi:hypothetical protein
MFVVRTATTHSTHRDLASAIAVARNEILRGRAVAISTDETHWWTLTKHGDGAWQINHLYTFVSLFDQTPRAHTTWQQRAIDLLARLDDERDITPQPQHQTMEVNAS